MLYPAKFYHFLLLFVLAMCVVERSIFKATSRFFLLLEKKKSLKSLSSRQNVALTRAVQKSRALHSHAFIRHYEFKSDQNEKKKTTTQ